MMMILNQSWRKSQREQEVGSLIASLLNALISEANPILLTLDGAVGGLGGKLSSTSKNLTLLPGLSTGLSSSSSEIAVSSMGFASEIRAFSRDAIKEREKINTEARNTYAGLDQRYSDLTDDLLLVDNAYLGKIPSQENLTLLPGLSTGLSSSSSEIASENGLPLPVPSEIFSNFDLESSSSSSMSARDLTPGVVY
jgi:hypothetical protein